MVIIGHSAPDSVTARVAKKPIGFLRAAATGADRAHTRATSRPRPRYRGELAIDVVINRLTLSFSVAVSFLLGSLTKGRQHSSAVRSSKVIATCHECPVLPRSARQLVSNETLQCRFEVTDFSIPLALFDRPVCMTARSRRPVPVLSLWSAICRSNHPNLATHEFCLRNVQIEVLPYFRSKRFQPIAPMPANSLDFRHFGRGTRLALPM